jgi:hypothetical protein
MVTFFDLFTPLAVQTGILCATGQIILYLLFVSKTFGTTGPWYKMPSFTAHQIVVIPVLAYLSIQGLRELDLTGIGDTSNAVDRLTSPSHREFSEFVIGMMFFWDIPTGLCTSALRDLPMVLHHIGMFTTAAISMGALSHGIPILGFYGPFYFGLIEISSLPLIAVDIFHPKHKAWNAYLTSNECPNWVMKVNEIARPLFALLFILLRTIAFPYVSVMGVLKDVMYVTSLPLDQRNNVPSLPLYIMAFLNVSFSILQLYWGTLLARQIMKLLGGSKSKTKSS